MFTALRLSAALMTATAGLGIPSGAPAQLAHGSLGVGARVMTCSVSGNPAASPPARAGRNPSGNVAGVQVTCPSGMAWTSTVEEGVIGGSTDTPASRALETRADGQPGLATSDGPHVPQTGTTVRVVTLTF